MEERDWVKDLQAAERLPQGPYAVVEAADGSGAYLQSTEGGTRLGPMPTEVAEFVAAARESWPSAIRALLSKTSRLQALEAEAVDRRAAWEQAQQLIADLSAALARMLGPTDAECCRKLRDAPTNRDLIAELVRRLHSVKGIAPARGHYQLIGKAYNRFGYHAVAAAIEDLELETAAREELGMAPIGEKDLWAVFLSRCERNYRPPRGKPESGLLDEGSEERTPEVACEYERLPNNRARKKNRVTEVVQDRAGS